MQFFCRALVCRCRLVKLVLVEVAEMDAFTAVFDFHSPLFVSMMPANSFEAAGVFRQKALIAFIFGSRCFAEIDPAIVRVIAISVVNFMRRPRAGHVKPRKPMRPIKPATYADLLTSNWIVRTSLSRGEARIPRFPRPIINEMLTRPHAPCEDASLSGIIQALSEVIGVKHCSSIHFKIEWGEYRPVSPAGPAGV